MGHGGLGLVSCYQSLMPDGIILIGMFVFEISFGFLPFFFSYGVKFSMTCEILEVYSGQTDPHSGKLTPLPKGFPRRATFNKNSKNNRNYLFLKSVYKVQE
jgi:hypothetical protein